MSTEGNTEAAHMWWNTMKQKNFQFVVKRLHLAAVADSKWNHVHFCYVNCFHMQTPVCRYPRYKQQWA